MRYNNFLSFLVQSKAITPLAETTLKRVTFTTWSHNEADPDDRPREGGARGLHGAQRLRPTWPSAPRSGRPTAAAGRPVAGFLAPRCAHAGRHTGPPGKESRPG